MKSSGRHCFSASADKDLIFQQSGNVSSCLSGELIGRGKRGRHRDCLLCRRKRGREGGKGLRLVGEKGRDHLRNA